MLELSDELKIINSSINFSNEKGLDYTIMRYPTICAFKHVEINLGKGPIHSKPEPFFGASFATDNNGKLIYSQIHVFPLQREYMDQTEEFRLYLGREHPTLDVRW